MNTCDAKRHGLRRMARAAWGSTVRAAGGLAYGARFYGEKLQRLIPHPRLRAQVFRLMGAEIGHAVRIEDVKLVNLGMKGLRGLEIGDDSLISTHTVLDLTERIIIGKKCAIGATIFTHQDPGSFLFDSPIVRRYPRREAPVRIGDNAYIGANSVILCGVEIGENSVVGAGSVVIRDVPSNTVVAGVPAQIKNGL